MSEPVLPNMIHYTELPPTPPGGLLDVEYEFYRREVGRLLAEGHEGKHVLIKGEAIIGIYETDREALDAGYERFSNRGGFFVRKIQTWERMLRVSRRVLESLEKRCRTSP
jgi:hypothetical protein